MNRPEIVNYYTYSKFLKDRYGERVYKLPINLPVTCPNRDGEVSTCGCTFCAENGAGLECLPQKMPVSKQIGINREYIGKRYNAKKFIAYFQNFSNTYLPFEDFKKYIFEAIDCGDDIVELAISTRPDCINNKICDFLQEIQEDKGVNITIELGLQTANYHSLIDINRGHTLAEYIIAANLIKGHNLMLTTHVILNLPNDDIIDVIETAKVLTALKSDFVKIHGLFIVKGTVMAKDYLDKKFTIITPEEYVERVAIFLRHIAPNIAVQRLIGRSDEEEAIFSNWGRSSWIIKEAIEDLLIEKDYFQGDLCDYLDGRSIKKFYSHL
ncbi:MAG: TIGR01212 family radical SAM protein [Lachnospirales bacterium]